MSPSRSYQFKVWRAHYEEALEQQALVNAAKEIADKKVADLLALHPDTVRAQKRSRPVGPKPKPAAHDEVPVRKKPACRRGH